MSDFLGIDTSNYTTSAAIYESSHNVLLQEKMLLPVSAALAAIGSKNITSIKNVSVVTVFFTFRIGLHII